MIKVTIFGLRPGGIVYMLDETQVVRNVIIDLQEFVPQHHFLRQLMIIGHPPLNTERTFISQGVTRNMAIFAILSIRERPRTREMTVSSTTTHHHAAAA